MTWEWFRQDVERTLQPFDFLLGMPELGSFQELPIPLSPRYGTLVGPRYIKNVNSPTFLGSS